MNKFFYKEWIKTRWYLLLMFLVTLGFAGYAMLRVRRVAELNGIAHVWEVMIAKDVVFVDTLQYVPVLAGLLLALVQFMPEMYHKCLKLTLHLPCSQERVLCSMLCFGGLALAVCFAASYLLMFACLQEMLAPELYRRIGLSALPWYEAGLASYLLGAWICLEPAWKRRVPYMVVALLVLRIYFMAPAPEAYNGFMPCLTVGTLLLASLPWLSVVRFKAGEQD